MRSTLVLIFALRVELSGEDASASGCVDGDRGAVLAFVAVDLQPYAEDFVVSSIGSLMVAPSRTVTPQSCALRSSTSSMTARLKPSAAGPPNQLLGIVTC